ncbi:MAG: putative quorum-sensing-regulated virulence factor [Acinetobacter johnsonii]
MTTSTNSQEVINFGKHKGTALIDLDRAYVRWLLKLENLNGDLRKSLESLTWVKEAQRRKELAIALQRTHIPLSERRAFKRRMGWVGSR